MPSLYENDLTSWGYYSTVRPGKQSCAEILLGVQSREKGKTPSHPKGRPGEEFGLDYWAMGYLFIALDNALVSLVTYL